MRGRSLARRFRGSVRATCARSSFSRKLTPIMRTAAALALLLATTAAAPPPPKKPSVQETNDQMAAKVLKSIAGHENEPAEQVFMDIRIERLKSVPAARFITIMNQGYAKALGVTCTHCHVETDFSSDDKRPKRVAREMAAMHTAINKMLHDMKEIEDPPDERYINCSTCHRGSIDPRESAAR
jgi:hypothetical protein